MKKLVLFLLICSSTQFSFSQKLSSNDLPKAVTNAFTSSYSNVDDVMWTRHGNKYVVRFEVGRTDYKAIYGEDGKLQMYKKEITIEEVPAAILSAINRSFKGHKIESVEKVVKEGDVFYQMEVDSKTSYAKVVYTEDGEPDHVNFWD